MTGCSYEMHQVLQSVADFMTKCDSYYKVGRTTCIKRNMYPFYLYFERGKMIFEAI